MLTDHQTTVHVGFDIDVGALAAVRRDPVAFAEEMRIAAAVKWYELQRISQGRAAEIAGLSRSGFIDALSQYGVSPFQETAEEVIAELKRNDPKR